MKMFHGRGLMKAGRQVGRQASCGFIFLLPGSGNAWIDDDDDDDGTRRLW
jgi:hypothetical protein